MIKLKNPFKFKKHAPEYAELLDIVIKNYQELEGPQQALVTFGLINNWSKYVNLIADAAKRPAQEAHLMFQTDIVLAIARDMGYDSILYNNLEATDGLEAEMAERVALACLNKPVSWFKELPIETTDRLWVIPTSVTLYTIRGTWGNKEDIFNNLKTFTRMDTSNTHYVASKTDIKNAILRSLFMHRSIPKFLKGDNYEV